MIDRQLGMLLGIVIRLIGVVGSRVGAVGSSSGIFACRVIAAVGTIDAIGGVVVHSIPAHACLLATTKEATNYLCLSAIPTEVSIVGVEVGGGTIEKTIGVDLGESGIGLPATRQHDMGVDHLAESVVHAAVEGDTYG